MQHPLIVLAPAAQLIVGRLHARSSNGKAARILIDQDGVDPGLVDPLTAELGRVLADAVPGALVACHLDPVGDPVHVDVAGPLVSVYLRPGTMPAPVADDLAGAVTYLLHRRDTGDGDGLGRQTLQLPRS